MKYNLILYGAGRRCERLCQILPKENMAALIIIDSNPDRWGHKLEECLVEPPLKIRDYKEWNLCITIAEPQEVQKVREDLQQLYSYNLEKEIGYNELILKAFTENSLIRETILSKAIFEEKMINIVFDSCNGFGLGGVEAWTTDICQELIKKGHENIYIISDKGDYNIPEILQKHVLFADINHKARFSVCSILNIIEQIMASLPCKVVTRDVDDVMLASYLIKCFYPDMLDIISVIHDNKEKNCKEYIDFRKCTDIYIGVSQDIREDMIQRGVAPEYIYTMTCPFPCDETLTRTYTEDYNQPIHIGYAGRMEYSQKRMDLFLKLIEVLVDRKIHFKLEFAGDGSAKKDLENFVSINHLEEQVKFLGKLERAEMGDFWKKQDVCLNLADFEGRSISIIEAMGNGAVPVVTATSGVKEDITDGLNGYVIPLQDYQSMAEKIEYLEGHRECLSKMGALAHDVVYPKSLMSEHLKFWEKILSLSSH